MEIFLAPIIVALLLFIWSEIRFGKSQNEMMRLWRESNDLRRAQYKLSYQRYELMKTLPTPKINQHRVMGQHRATN